jgi:hypothetical protein
MHKDKGPSIIHEWWYPYLLLGCFTGGIIIGMVLELI